MVYPRAMPGLVTGMAFFWSFVIIDPSGRIRASLWAIGIAFAVRSLALGYSAFYPQLAALGEDLDRAARTAGADWWTAMRTIVFRLLRPAMAVSFVLLFVAMLNDYDPAVFLVTPGTEVMGLTMLKLWVGGTAGNVLLFVAFDTRLSGFARGLVDTRDVVFFLSVTATCLVVSFRALERRKWA
jgi:iron(III) transport system permease protein